MARATTPTATCSTIPSTPIPGTYSATWPRPTERPSPTTLLGGWQKISGTYQFVYAPNGGKQPLAEMQGQSLLSAFLPLPGGAVANYNSSGLNQYNHADWLGSARLFSSPSRVATPAMAYAPFGEGYAGGQQYVQFTSAGNAWTVYDNENQTGSLEDFMFRRYNPTQGRWISPDPAGLGAVDPSNPQTCNRYAYVMNNPLNLVDPLGLGGAGIPEAILHHAGTFQMARTSTLGSGNWRSREL